jgi:hypothetical protein
VFLSNVNEEEKFDLSTDPINLLRFDNQITSSVQKNVLIHLIRETQKINIFVRRKQ